MLPKRHNTVAPSVRERPTGPANETNGLWVRDRCGCTLFPGNVKVEGEATGEAAVPFQPSEPIVAIRETDPDAEVLLPVSAMRPLEPSRHVRNSGDLPNLGDDSTWIPPGSDFVTTIVEDEPRRWFHVFRY